MSIGDNIRKYRNKKGLTQIELATISLCSESSIRKYEKGIRIPGSAILNKIAAALDISINDLIGDNPQNQLDIAREQIDENSKRNDIEYNQLYNSIENLFENYDYILESDDCYNSIDEELITINKNNHKILIVRKSVLISSGENILKLINEFNEFAIQKLINELKNK